MKRLTTRNENGTIGIGEPLRPYNYEDIKGVLERLANIEDILGDDYDLDRLRELIESCKGLYPSEIAENKLLIATRKDPEKLARMAELVEADRDGRCHIGRCVECSHYEGLAVCEFLGDCGGTNWIFGWFEPRQAAEIALKGEQNESQT